MHVINHQISSILQPDDNASSILFVYNHDKHHVKEKALFFFLFSFSPIHDEYIILKSLLLQVQQYFIPKGSNILLLHATINYSEEKKEMDTCPIPPKRSCRSSVVTSGGKFEM